MPRRRWKLRVEDILEAIDKVQRYTQGLDFERFAANSQVIEAVVFNFIVIGEAARHVPPAIISRYDNMPWRIMRGMRNLVVHEYWGVNIRVLWETVQNDLTPLVPMLKKIVAEPDNAGE